MERKTIIKWEGKTDRRKNSGRIEEWKGGNFKRVDELEWQANEVEKEGTRVSIGRREGGR